MLCRKNITLVLTLFIIIFSSCKNTYQCVEATPVLMFVSFSDTTTDSIIIRKYIKNDMFNSPVDTTTLTKNNSSYEWTNDTLQVHRLNDGGDYPLDIHYDYEVDMPLANKLFKISNITQQQTEINEGLSMDKRGCVNPITSYTLNGATISGTANAYFFYLKN